MTACKSASPDGLLFITDVVASRFMRRKKLTMFIHQLIAVSDHINAVAQTIERRETILCKRCTITPNGQRALLGDPIRVAQLVLGLAISQGPSRPCRDVRHIRRAN